MSRMKLQSSPRSALPMLLVLAALLAGMLAAMRDAHAATAPHASTSPPPTDARIFGRPSSNPYTLALRAYVWGYPLVAAAEARLTSTNPSNPFVKRPPYNSGAALDNIGFQRVLSSPAFKAVTPNNTTLYSPAWLDTDHGPFVLLTPNFGKRYYTFQMAQADTSSRESLGQRVNGPKLRPIFIYGPHWRGRVPRGMTGVRSDFRYFFILGRILTNPSRPGDVQRVHALQGKVKLITWARYRAGRRGGRNPAPAQAPLDLASDNARFAFMYELSRVMSELTPVADDRQLVKSFTRIGLSAHGFDLASLSPAARSQVTRALRAGPRVVARAADSYGTIEHGWSFSFQGPDFGTDWLRRAVIAKVLPFVNLPHESIYPKATTDAAGRPLTGSRTYDLHFAKGQLPPARFFWSLIAYNAEGYMVDNPIHRYSLGNLTPGLVTNSDGSLDVVISHTRPTGRLAANWLPAPAGRFFMVLRLYDASRAVFNRTWKPPLIVDKSTVGTGVR